MGHGGGGGRDRPSWAPVEGGDDRAPLFYPRSDGAGGEMCVMLLPPPTLPGLTYGAQRGGLGFLLCPLSRGGPRAPEPPHQPPRFSPGDANGEVRGGHEAHLRAAGPGRGAAGPALRPDCILRSPLPPCGTRGGDGGTPRSLPPPPCWVALALPCL